MAIGILRHKGPGVNVETIKEDIRRLNEDFRGVLYSAGKQSKEKINEGGKRLGSAFRALSDSAKAKVGTAYERISDQSKEAVEIGRRKIALRPIASVLTALSAGLVVGMLVKR